jgi:hypothetical protein
VLSLIRGAVLMRQSSPGATLLNFDRHFEVFEGAYQWCRRRIDKLGEQNNAALAAILATRD